MIEDHEKDMLDQDDFRAAKGIFLWYGAAVIFWIVVAIVWGFYA